MAPTPAPHKSRRFRRLSEGANFNKCMPPVDVFTTTLAADPNDHDLRSCCSIGMLASIRRWVKATRCTFETARCLLLDLSRDRSASVRLDAGRPDHLAPLFGFVDDE